MDKIRPPLKDIDGELFIEGVSTLRLAEEFDTPLYIISKTKIIQNYRHLVASLRKKYDQIRVVYSAKANTNLAVLKILRNEGSGLDAVSPGEVFLARRAGFSPDRILFTGTSVRDDELRYMLREKVLINVDSLSQLKRLLSLASPEFLSVRINPEIGAGHHDHVITAGKASKFGIWEGDAKEAYGLMKQAGVSRFGIQMHIGSGIMDAEPYLLAAEKILTIARMIHEDVGIDFDFIDFGGGIGVPYRPDEKGLDIDDFSERLMGLFTRRLKDYSLGDPELWFEPGRFLVAESGILLTRINTLKETPHRRFAGIDAGFNTLVRPTMYGSYHHIVVANKLNRPLECTYDVVGPLCESGDTIAKDRPLPRLSEGDLLAVLDVGAYGFSMSSTYNSRLRAVEVMVNEGEHELVRERETFNELLRGQRIPAWLEATPHGDQREK